MTHFRATVTIAVLLVLVVGALAPYYGQFPPPRQVLGTVPRVPTPVWGRDELGAGEMWNSNSVTAWIVSRSGLEAAPLKPPAGGRAPGWNAGLVVAGRLPRS